MIKTYKCDTCGNGHNYIYIHKFLKKSFIKYCSVILVTYVEVENIKLYKNRHRFKISSLKKHADQTPSEVALKSVYEYTRCSPELATSAKRRRYRILEAASNVVHESAVSSFILRARAILL